FTAMKISTQIQDWCRMAGAKVVRNPTADLAAWHAAVQAKTLRHESEQFYLKQLRGWAGQIRSLLDPPRERDLPDSCPVCGATAWWDPKSGTKYLRPLVVQYRPNGPDMLQQARALCRACEQVWGI